MDLQKIKQALELARDMMDRQYIGTIETIEDALAELGKPTDGDVIVLAERCLTIYEHESTENSCVRRISSLFHQYAESYHAKKCAECNQVKGCFECAHNNSGEESSVCHRCVGKSNWELSGKY